MKIVGDYVVGKQLGVYEPGHPKNMMARVILQNILAAEGLLERKRSKVSRKEEAKTEPKEGAEIESFRYVGQEPLELIDQVAVRRVEHIQAL